MQSRSGSRVTVPYRNGAGTDASGYHSIEHCGAWCEPTWDFRTGRNLQVVSKIDGCFVQSLI